MIIPVVITVYSDRSFTFIMKTPPASVLLKKAAGLATSKKPGSGSKEPNKNKVGKVSAKQVARAGPAEDAGHEHAPTSRPPCAAWPAPPARWASRSGTDAEVRSSAHRRDGSRANARASTIIAGNDRRGRRSERRARLTTVGGAPWEAKAASKEGKCRKSPRSK